MQSHPTPSAHVCTPTDLPPGTRYAGTPLDAAGNPTHHVLLLPARPEQDLNWQAAKEWAASAGGQLPSRQEQALLFTNCKDALPQAWCWSNEENAGDASYAWGCLFDDGFQSLSRKSFEGSAVAVRRLPLESFNSFASAPSAPCARVCTHPALSKAEVSNIRKRLDRWELDHLRKLVQEQADRLETAQERIDALESEASRAWDAAESWRMNAMELVDDLQEAGQTIGLTQGGQLVVMGQQGGAA